MKFNTAEEAVECALSIPLKPKSFVDKNWRKRVARIGRYTNGPVTSPLFGKYYVDIQTPFGSANKNVPPSFPDYEAAKSYIESMGFKAIEAKE